MSYGETSSNATLPSQNSAGASEAPNLRKEVTDKCLDIVQQFRADKVTKSRATLLLQQTIPHETLEEDSFVSAYGTYLEMLDNFEAYQRGASRRIAETGNLFDGCQSDEQHHSADAVRVDPSVSPSKRARSPAGSDNDEDGEYKRRV